MRTRVDLQWLS